MNTEQVETGLDRRDWVEELGHFAIRLINVLSAEEMLIVETIHLI